MLLSHEEFYNAVEEIKGLPEGEGVAYDYETTGFSTKRNDRAFLLGFSHRNGDFATWLEGINPGAIQGFLSNPRIRYAAHNSKFERSFDRDQFGADCQGINWCTEVFDRVLYNNHRSYSLQNCAKRRGLSKFEPMMGWLKDNDHAYHKAPLELIIPYVEQDARLSYILMNEQVEAFKEWDKGPHPIRNIVRLEIATTRELFEMESHGFHVDVPYCQEALAYEKKRIEEARRLFQGLTGKELVDSRLCLEPIFISHGIPYSRTEKDNASFDSEALSASAENPIVQSILLSRDATKRASTYWENFLKLEVKGKLYPSIRQVGAATFRMSIAEPAAQTWPVDSEDSEDDSPYPVRRAFPASSPDHVIVSMDWQQMELRKMADEAGEMKMIRDFQGGHDFHQAVANMAKVPRSLAKNGRFAKLYGCGDARLAKTLKVPLPLAKKISEAIDDDSPRIAAYSSQLIRYAKSAPYGINWLGRRYYFDRGWEFKYPNYRIQGGCAEILRIAIIGVNKVLKGTKSRLVLPIHDELVFDFHKEELHLLPALKEVMIKAHHSKRFLDMDVSCAMGPNFKDLEEITV